MALHSALARTLTTVFTNIRTSLQNQPISDENPGKKISHSFGEPRSNNDIDKRHRLRFEAVLRAGLEVAVEITANPAQAQGHRGDKGRTGDKGQETRDR